jgi:PleD family two-component response regulator
MVSISRIETVNQANRYDYKILIVDDQSFNIEALKIILHYCIGLNTQLYCSSALSGQQAFQMVKDDFE